MLIEATTLVNNIIRKKVNEYPSKKHKIPFFTNINSSLKNKVLFVQLSVCWKEHHACTLFLKILIKTSDIGNDVFLARPINFSGKQTRLVDD